MMYGSTDEEILKDFYGDYKDENEARIRYSCDQCGSYLDVIRWHPYPKEKPTDGTYLVCYTLAGETDMAFDDYRLGEFWDNGDRVFAWAEMPAPYKEEP